MYNITLVLGDGIGPEVSKAAARVVDATGVSVQWDVVEAGADVMDEYGTPLPEHVLDSIRKNKVALKGPITTPIGCGFRSVNVALRKELDLYTNLRPAHSYEGISSRYQDVDLVIVRENTEGLYSGIEHWVGNDAAETIKIITRKASERIVRFAFDYARENGRKKVTAVHKANIQKYTDGLFLECARKVAEEYNDIELEDVIIDAMCMNLVINPHQFGVMVMPNFYGDILSDLCAGMVGGLGVAPGANIGKEIAVFEPVHGSAPTIAGQNKANPVACMLSAVMMLHHIGEHEAAKRMHDAIAAVLADGKNVTADLGGNAGTSDITDAIIAKLQK